MCSIKNSISNFNFTPSELVKNALSFSLGLASIPLNVIVHEWGHAIAAKILLDGCHTAIHYRGLALMDTRFSIKKHPDMNSNIKVLISAAGPIAENIAILSALHFFNSKYTPIVVLPHLAHLVFNAVLPIFTKTSNDFNLVLAEGGPFAYLATLEFAMVPVALILYKLYPNFFAS